MPSELQLTVPPSQDASARTVSVAMCTYNGAAFLAEQLESIRTQTRLPDQLVICDDTSTDSTREILQEFARSAPFPVQLKFNPIRLGATKNFEQALLACTGDLVALCDQDDRWHPDKLKRFSELLAVNSHCGFACSNADLIDHRGRRLGRHLWDEWRINPVLLAQQSVSDRAGYLLRANCVTGATMVLNRALLYDYLSPIPASWVHDHWFVLLCEILQAPGCATPELLTQYRSHSGQTLGLKNHRWIRRWRTSAQRDQSFLVGQQRLRDLKSILTTQILPQNPDARVWIDFIRQARQQLTIHYLHSNLPWWHREWNRLWKRRRPAGGQSRSSKAG